LGQLKSLGVKPAGSNGYYQPVKFLVREISEKDSSLTLVRDGKATPLTLGEEAYFGLRAKLAPEVEAPLVFVGYGLNIPEKNYNDLEGLDLKGKIAVILTGSPAAIPGPLASHYPNRCRALEDARAAGVVGVVTIPNPAFMDYPLVADPRPIARIPAWISRERSSTKQRVRRHPSWSTRRTRRCSLPARDIHFEEIAALAKDRKALPGFPFPFDSRQG